MSSSSSPTSNHPPAAMDDSVPGPSGLTLVYTGACYGSVQVAFATAVAEAGDGSSTNGSNGTPFWPRKRVRNPHTRKAVAKQKGLRERSYAFYLQ